MKRLLLATLLALGLCTSFCTAWYLKSVEMLPDLDDILYELCPAKKSKADSKTESKSL